MREVKVRILSTCPHCDGVAYFPFKETTDTQGRKYMQYLPCTICHGSGVTAKWITLPEFQKLVEQSLCAHSHIERSGSYYLSDGEITDNIEEFCRDCGQVLD